ncbi:Ankyrin repeat protein 1 [Giardia muris]|uniref:Ankyrin repeat protein 1 n=1 Tax=Giardia muris TaxID=5742 RepID=A0A4Z1SVX6_GIAMU|nr:Ankyrin repeat protein 1 [Giardia muris]|eukprot:TNJ27728.1 Ankyrin repeat protein 1 [Giardia muris]
MNPISDRKAWVEAVTQRAYTTVRVGLRLFAGSTNAIGETGLMLAARTNDTELAKILCIQEAGIQNKEGLTALIIAACYGNADVCDVIAPFEKKFPTATGKNALMFAAEFGNVDAVKVLCNYFDYRETDVDGLSSLDYAMNAGKLDCVDAIQAASKLSEEALNRQIAASVRNQYGNLTEFYEAVQATNYTGQTCLCCNLPIHLCKDKGNLAASIRRVPPSFIQNPSSYSASVTAQFAQDHGISADDPSRDERLREYGKELCVAQTKAWYADLCSEVVELRTKNHAYMQERSELLDKLANETADLNKLSDGYKKLREEHERVMLQHEDLKIKYNIVQHENAKVLRDCEEMRHQRFEAEALHQRICELIAHRDGDLVGALETMIATHREEMSKRTKELELMKQSVDVMSAEHAAVQREVEKLTESKVQIEAQASLLQNRLLAKEEEARHMSNRLEHTTQMINELESKNNELELETSRLMDEITHSKLMTEQLMTRIQEKDHTLNATRDELAQTLGEREALLHRLTFAAEDKANVEARLQRRAKDITTLHEDKRELEGQVIYLTEELTKSQIAAQNMASKMRLENPLKSASGGLPARVPQQQQQQPQHQVIGNMLAAGNSAFNPSDGQQRGKNASHSSLSGLMRNMTVRSDVDLQQAILDSDKVAISDNIISAMIRGTHENFDAAGVASPGTNNGPRSPSTASRFLNLKLAGTSMRARKDLYGRDANINVTGQDKRGDRLTELMEAARDNDFDKAYHRIAIQGGLRDDQGCTALMYAAANGHLEMCRILVDAEAGFASYDGTTALMRAASNGHVDVVTFLLDKEGGMQRDDGWTALMAAACDNRPELITVLVHTEAGLATNEKFPAGAGVTALMLAATGGHQECVQLLLPYEANMKHSTGRTAADYTSSEELRELILGYE